MNRKLSLTIIALLAALSTASAVAVMEFTSWGDLLLESPDIVIARCTAAPMRDGWDGIVRSEIEVVTVLKGETKPAAAEMVSQYWPHQGEQFLMFSTYLDNKLYRAYESYRIIPMSRIFPTGELTGKPLNEQIQLILRRRLDDLRQKPEQNTNAIQGLEQWLYKLPVIAVEAQPFAPIPFQLEFPSFVASLRLDLPIRMDYDQPAPTRNIDGFKFRDVKPKSLLRPGPPIESVFIDSGQPSPTENTRRFNFNGDFPVPDTANRELESSPNNRAAANRSGRSQACII